MTVSEILVEVPPLRTDQDLILSIEKALYAQGHLAILKGNLGPEGSVANVTDGRCFGGTWGRVVGHVAPEAFKSATIALVQAGDSITINAHRLLLRLNVPDDAIARCRAVWQRPSPRYIRGVLGKFSRNAASASRGAILTAERRWAGRWAWTRKVQSTVSLPGHRQGRQRAGAMPVLFCRA